MNLASSAADDDTHDTEQHEGYAADDEPMRKIELFYNGNVFHPSGSSQWFSFLRGSRIGATEFGAGFVGCEHPFDAVSLFISLPLPSRDLVSELFGVVDAAAEALALQHADLALDHIEPAGVFRGVVGNSRRRRMRRASARKCLIQRAGGMDRQIVLHDTDAGGIGVVDIDEFAHAVRRRVRRRDGL